MRRPQLLLIAALALMAINPASAYHGFCDVPGWCRDPSFGAIANVQSNELCLASCKVTEVNIQLQGNSSFRMC